MTADDHPQHDAGAESATRRTDVGIVAMAVTHDRHAEGRIRLARNVLLVLTSQIGIWVAGAGLAILLPRFVTDKDIGRLTFATSFTSIFTLIVLFGSERYLTREVARQPDAAAHLAFNALLTRVPLFAASIAMMAAFLAVFDYSRTTIQIVFVFTISMAITGVGNTLIAVLQGHERMAPAAVAAIFERVLSGVAGLGVVVFAGMGMVAYASVLMLANAFSVLLIGWIFLRTVGLSWHVDMKLCRAILGSSSPFFIWGLALFIYGSIDITILSVTTNDAVVGWYGTAYRFIGIAGFFPFAITTALLPNIASMEPIEYRPVARRCLDIVNFASIPIAVFFIVGAQEIINFLGYPEEFDNSAILLRILAIHVPLVGFTMIGGTLLIASNREGPRTKAAVVAAVMSPLLNLALIPIFQSRYDNGAIGSAISTFAIELFIVGVVLWLLEPQTFTRANLNTAARCAAAAAPMALVMYAVLPVDVAIGPVDATLLLVMLAGSVTYMAAALALRAVSLDELVSLPKLALGSRRPRIEPVEGLELSPGRP